ncbi:HAD hydrolase, family IE [Phytophthora cinnamomi]|uniref:HAD hydrolase, family IE n=1 Tax=Phytophthora cinnamomi TaxID=4785 RepID=UPI003559A8E4|nr:HAD hydrolase, family IE [Phytophthora cinnamomi]
MAANNKGQQRRAPRMIFKDPDDFTRKIKKFARDGADQLLVISDFDRTLTPYYKPCGDPNEPLVQESSSHQVLLTSSLLPPTVAEEDAKLFARYYPVEISPTLSLEEKLPLMEEWWTSINYLLVESKVALTQVKEAVESSHLSFRRGFNQLTTLLHDRQVPTLVFSAGLYDVIHVAPEKEFAAKRGCGEGIHTGSRVYTPANIHVVSNMMHFDARGTVESFRGRTVHPLTQAACSLLDSPFWTEQHLDQRRNILLLGDSRGDVRMTEGLDAHEIIRVGFLNVHVEEALDEYLDLYDVVLTNDASLIPVGLLVEQIMNGPKSDS